MRVGLEVGTGAKEYLYNGKELNTDFGLDWLDYGARWYDPSIARFHTIDPLAEDYSFQNPFTYADNNPIRFIDYMGMNAAGCPDGDCPDDPGLLDRAKNWLVSKFDNWLGRGSDSRGESVREVSQVKTNIKENKEIASNNAKERLENLPENAVRGAGEYAEAMQDVGDGAIAAGTVGAYVNPPAGGVVVTAGAIVSGAGAGLEAAVDALDGNYDDAAKTLVIEAAPIPYGNKLRKVSERYLTENELKILDNWFTSIETSTKRVVTNAVEE